MVHVRRNQVWRAFAATRTRTSLAPPLLAAVALLHGLLFIWLVPPWQTPDEPTQFAYAALIAEHGRVPDATTTDTLLEERIVASMVHNHFFERLIGHTVTPTPRTFDDVRQTFFMPDQVGNDPPLYFVLAAAPIVLLQSQPIESQLLALRLLGVVFVVGTVLCIYGAAGELQLGNGFAASAGMVAALQPMFVFIGIGAGNDSLANLIGAGICWLLLRTARRGGSLRRLVLLAVLLLLGMLTKRTLLPVITLVALLAVGWAIVRCLGLQSPLWARLGILVATLLALLVVGRLVITGSRDMHTAADWVGETANSSAARALSAPRSGAAALELNTGRVAVQAIPDVASEWAQNQTLRVAARTWTASGTASGHVAIDYGWAMVELPFETNRHAHTVQLRTFIPLYAPYLHVLLRSDKGTIYADHVSAESDRQRGVNLLSNGDATVAGWRQGVLPAQLARFLRVNTLGWLWQSGRLLEPPPLGMDLGRIFFVSFWGQFGWMTLPLVGATGWEGALLLLCSGGMVGVLGWLFAPGHALWQRRAVGLLLLLVLVGLLFPLANAYTQPRSQAMQQGRYLFTAMAPVVLLLVLGWRTLLPHHWYRAALFVGASFGVCFAGAALWLVARFYR